MEIRPQRSTGRPTRFGRAALVDLALAALLLGLAAALWWSAARAAEREIAEHGYTIDTGAYEQMFVLLVVLPTAVVLLLAARGNARRQAWAGPLHVLGIVGTLAVATIIAYFAYVSYFTVA